MAEEVERLQDDGFGTLKLEGYDLIVRLTFPTREAAEQAYKETIDGEILSVRRVRS